MTYLILIVAWLWVCGSGVVVAGKGEDPRSTHPGDYATVVEVRRDGRHRLVRQSTEIIINSTKIRVKDPTVTEIDDRSLISISFDEEKMKRPEKGTTRVKVKVRVEAFQTKNDDRDRIAPITNYVIRQADQQGNPDFKYRDKSYDPDNGCRVPNTIIDPQRLSEKDVDQIEIRIINLKTKERLVYFLRPRKLGFRTKLTDTFMFFKRPGVEDPLDSVNFSPATGVTFGVTWLPRKGTGLDKWIRGPLRVLRPGIGVNASILKWNDPALRGSRLNVGLGPQISLFNNLLMFTYGANLQAEQARWYYGIGVSIIQLNGAISGNDR